MGIFPGSNGSSHREMPRGAHPEEARTPHEFVNDPSAGSPTERFNIRAAFPKSLIRVGVVAPLFFDSL